jgi:hypothetical protein
MLRLVDIPCCKDIRKTALSIKLIGIAYHYNTITVIESLATEDGDLFATYEDIQKKEENL